MATNTKDTIYIDVDDEITAIIDKVAASPHKIVALVLPKRSTTLQSIVNMKLLKRSADEANKNLVLVTTEAGLMPLAGAVGLHVAATPQSRPVIPQKPTGSTDADEEDYDDSVFEQKGSLAGSNPLINTPQTDEEDTIQLDNDEPDENKVAAPVAASKAGKPNKPKAPKGKNKKLKVPNFNSFRNRLIFGGGALLLLIFLFVMANVVLPKAELVVKTDSQDIQSSLDITFDTNANEVNKTRNIVPAQVTQEDKTTTQAAPATGQQNNGEKAEGQVKIINCSAGDSLTIPAGTTVSANDQAYITQQMAVMPIGSKQCKDFGGISSVTVDIVAAKPGEQYNTRSTTFSVNGYTSNTKATGSANGSTDNIIKIVTQADINSAQQKLAAQADSSVKDELADKLQNKGLYVVQESFNTGNPEVSASAKPGDQVDSVTVTQKTTYSMVGAKKADIETLIKHNIEDQIDKSKQEVLNTGLDKGTFKLQSQQDGSSKVLMALSVISRAGPRLDDTSIKSQVAGKKSNEAKTILMSYPGVTDVEVKYSPFWVSSIPKSAKKITLTYEK